MTEPLYKRLPNGGYLRTSDSAGIPEDHNNTDYQAVLAWLAAGGQPLPWQEPPPAVPQEIPRWAGVLALKLHALIDGQLQPLEAAPAGTESLYGQVQQYRAQVSDVIEAARIDAALIDAKDWVRSSPTLAALAALLGLSQPDVDVLFTWAAAQQV